ncbi:hypothetical protein LA080_012018 [Diaporthe eres]|nr:hypothetical protein LA080_012018 [Diaporthe eres]
MGGSGPSPPSCCRTKQGIAWKDAISLGPLLPARVTAARPERDPATDGRSPATPGAADASRAPRGHATAPKIIEILSGIPTPRGLRSGPPRAARAVSRAVGAASGRHPAAPVRHAAVCGAPRGRWTEGETEGETEGAAREPAPWARLASAGLFTHVDAPGVLSCVPPAAEFGDD